jgi:hypothetical protein
MLSPAQLRARAVRVLSPSTARHRHRRSHTRGGRAATAVATDTSEAPRMAEVRSMPRLIRRRVRPGRPPHRPADHAGERVARRHGERTTRPAHHGSIAIPPAHRCRPPEPNGPQHSTPIVVSAERACLASARPRRPPCWVRSGRRSRRTAPSCRRPAPDPPRSSTTACGRPGGDRGRAAGTPGSHRRFRRRGIPGALSTGGASPGSIAP